MGNRARMTDIIDMESYEIGYNAGYADACENNKERKRQLNPRAKRRILYFLKQKAMGVALLAITAASIKCLDGDATVGLITVPLGLMLIFSRKRIITSSYY